MPTLNTLRRFSSAISDIWAAPDGSDRWGLILAASQNNGAEPSLGGWQGLGGRGRVSEGEDPLTDIRQTMHEARGRCVCGTNRGASLYTRYLLDGYRVKEAICTDVEGLPVSVTRQRKSDYPVA